ncbi:hypothetical protein M885DRAFT_489729 [Pelagophyceae sp. CCMP2097]|nr:hypothetical protein M885DRAFT_489729 [Pelagophyceae sp. CCMP2097]|mmetsp:Transcript_955/g.3403  ORF Transcript_955/g.3403 Transcript_955/m.3403 type:complete len:304 (-) Transcript_955:493-1404(-)
MGAALSLSKRAAAPPAAAAAAPKAPVVAPEVSPEPAAVDEAAAAWSAGPPNAAVVEAGKCVLGDDWTALPLQARTWVASDTVVLSFALKAGQPLNLATCACVLARIGEVVRPYTPVSTNGMMGRFELMVKVYGEGGVSHALSKLPLGEKVDFKHIPQNVKRQYPFGAAKLSMLCGGSGVTPMLQALHAILGTDTDVTEVSFLYASKTSTNILAKDALDAWACPRLKVKHVLSQEPADSPWTGARGRIDAQFIRDHFQPPQEGALIFVCGPAQFYDAFCGPRGETEITGVLGELGYTKDMVVKF